MMKSMLILKHHGLPGNVTPDFGLVDILLVFCFIFFMPFCLAKFAHYE